MFFFGGGKGKTYRDDEEHVHVLIEILEPVRVVGESIARIGGGGVAQEDTLDLAGEFGRHCGIVPHHVAVGRVGHEDEFSSGKSLEDLDEEIFPDRQCGIDVAEVEGPGVEGTARVGLVDELHVVPRRLFRRRGQVVEVEVGQAARPVGIYLWHVHPGSEGPGERVQ